MTRRIPDEFHGRRLSSIEEIEETAVELFEHQNPLDDPLDELFPNANPILAHVTHTPSPAHPDEVGVEVPLPYVHVTGLTTDDAAEILGLMAPDVDLRVYIPRCSV